MKKILLALMALGLVAASASAGVGISWQAQVGGYTHDAPNVTDYPSAFEILDVYSVTWQLIYAGTDNLIDPVDLSNGVNGWVSGDDAVWATRTVGIGGGTAPEDGSSWTERLLNTGGNTVYEDLTWNTAGYTFQRVYEGAPAELSYYFESSLVALDTGYTGSPGFPQYNFLDTPSAGFQPDQQIPAAPVPEPMTMSLMGLGALALAIRRRRS